MSFRFYDDIPIVSQPTTQEIVASLTNSQKINVLNGFAKNIGAKKLSAYTKIPYKVVLHLYNKMKEIEDMSAEYMNTDPTPTAQELLDYVKDTFSSDFTEGQVNAILTKMIDYSKHDGTGDWAFYRDSVVIPVEPEE